MAFPASAYSEISYSSSSIIPHSPPVSATPLPLHFQARTAPTSPPQYQTIPACSPFLYLITSSFPPPPSVSTQSLAQAQPDIPPRDFVSPHWRQTPQFFLSPLSTGPRILSPLFPPDGTPTPKYGRREGKSQEEGCHSPQVPFLRILQPIVCPPGASPTPSPHPLSNPLSPSRRFPSPNVGQQIPKRNPSHVTSAQSPLPGGKLDPISYPIFQSLISLVFAVTSWYDMSDWSIQPKVRPVVNIARITEPRITTRFQFSHPSFNLPIMSRGC